MSSSVRVQSESFSNEIQKTPLQCEFRSEFDIWKPQELQNFNSSNNYLSMFGDFKTAESMACEQERHLFYRVAPQAVMRIIGTEGSIIRRVQSTTHTTIVSPHRNQVDKVFRISAKHQDDRIALSRVVTAQFLLATLEDVTLGRQSRHPELVTRVRWLLDETAEQVGLLSGSSSCSSTPDKSFSTNCLVNNLKYTPVESPKERNQVFFDSNINCDKRNATTDMSLQFSNIMSSIFAGSSQSPIEQLLLLNKFLMYKNDASQSFNLGH